MKIQLQQKKMVHTGKGESAKEFVLVPKEKKHISPSIILIKPFCYKLNLLYNV